MGVCIPIIIQSCTVDSDFRELGLQILTFLKTIKQTKQAIKLTTSDRTITDLQNTQF